MPGAGDAKRPLAGMTQGRCTALRAIPGSSGRRQRGSSDRCSGGAEAVRPVDGQGRPLRPADFPQIVGLDGVGRLPDGTRVGFLPPLRPYGGMAEQALVRDGAWLPVSDGVDDVTAAAFLNPGMAAWKTIIWEGQSDHRVTAPRTLRGMGRGNELSRARLLPGAGLSFA
jgi:hypothetical protein